MKLPILIALFAVATLPFAPAAAQGEGTVTVTLEVASTFHLLPADTVCSLEVPAGANAGAVLDAATAAGCISGWAYAGEQGVGYGRYVTAVDGKSESTGFFWSYMENGRTASHGIDNAFAREGDVFGFGYSDYATGIAAGFLP